MHHLNEIGCK